ncbi:MAG TPA: cytochrome P450 [Acidimicrobiales bacterium]|nr:cytochrome P450 [Acidimicrobiales bacterium]
MREQPAPDDWFRFDVDGDERHYEGLAAKRRSCPVELVRPLLGTDEPMAVAYRYRDVVQIVSDESTFSLDKMGARYRPIFGTRSMLARPSHEHRHLRVKLASAVGPRSLPALRASIVEPVVDAVLDSVAASRSFDVVADLAKVVPTKVIARLLGAGEDEAPWLLQQTLAMVSYIDDPRVGLRAARALRRRLTELIAERRAAPGGDLVSALVDGSDGSVDDEIVDLLMLVCFAGTETTVPGLGSLFAALFLHVDQLDLVRRDPAFIWAAVDETLRWESPVQLTFRSTVEAVELSGVALPAGTTVLAHLGSANRELPGVADGDRFDIRRPPHTAHLAFGTGVRRCVGMALARLEMAVVLERVLDAFPRLRAVDLAAVRISGQFVRSPRSLEVRAA